jgi:uncharacterized membrane protein
MQITADREPGSPARLPVHADERVRFWGGWLEPLDPDAPWPEPRIMYLQHASDPVAFWSPELLLSQPEWMQEPPGPDVLPAFDWYPFVTFWQITADMAVSAKVPAGHAHNYGGELVDWDPALTEALRERVFSHPLG